MAEFSRIKVTPAAEEDIVIQAGAVDETVSDTTPNAPSVADAAAEEAAVVVEAAPRSSKRDAYEETTLEDLQHAGMSGMQKAIIAVAIVAVVAFIIWYVLVR